MENINKTSVNLASNPQNIDDSNSAIIQDVGHDSKDNSSRTVPLAEFTLFPKLPIELRLSIWKEACFVPRIIDVFLAPSINNADGNGYEEEHALDTIFSNHPRFSKTFTTVTARSPPAIIHASKESREVGLRYFSLTLGKSTKTILPGGDTVEISTPPKIYVNWKCDIICCTDTFDFIGHKKISKSCGTGMEDLLSNTSIRRLAITQGDLEAYKDLMHKSTLEELIVYIAPGLRNWEEARAEAQMETCDDFNTNTRFAISFTDAQKYLENMIAQGDEELGDDNYYNQEDYEFCGSYVPSIKESDLKSANKDIKSVVRFIEQYYGTSASELPQINVMVMEIRDKDEWRMK